MHRYKILNFKNIIQLDMLVSYAYVSYLSEDGDLSPKHVRKFMCMDDLWFI
jgi:hypothetical protein